jgi:signal transduction histidine kinase
MFAEHLARVFVLLLETSLHTRTEALSAALAERARLSLYLQHDMRNLAQWVGWVSADFTACTAPEALLAAAKRLRDNAPLARERAERLTAALGKQPAADLPCRIDLRQAVSQAARLAGVEPDIAGEAQAWIAKGLLERALDNLFSNLAAAWRDAASVRPSLRLRSGDMAELEFFCPWPANIAPLAPEKIFEPFASGRPGGLGLGLYQARKSLREAGGELQATSSPSGLSFVLRVPAQMS